MTVERLIQMLEKYDPQDEVLVSLGGPNPLRTVGGIREGARWDHASEILNTPKQMVTIGGTPQRVALILA